jgi:hypothetical protein
VARRRRQALRRRLLAAAVLLGGLAALLVAVPTVSSSTSSVVGSRSALQVPPGITPPAAPGTPGLTVAGIRCRPGVRQVPFTQYSPICIPAWHGNNGGATAPGVTRMTITLTYRYASTTELSLLYALIPKTVVGTNEEAVRTMQRYVRLFNKYFELYGRKVVLVPYQGQGNFINEDTGSGQQEAQADAVAVAKKYHAFADMSLVDSSVIYTEELEQEHVIAFGLYLQDRAWYRAHAPWQYTPGPNCTKSAKAIATVLGKGFAGTPAIFAGDPSLRSKPRSYGIIYPNNPESTICAQELEADLARDGVKVTQTYSFTFDPSQLVGESETAVAQMQSRGVTTVICSSCDPVTPIYLFQAASHQGYHPEWFLQSYFALSTSQLDQFVQLFQKAAPDEARGIIGLGEASVAGPDEAVRAYEMANHGSPAGILPSYPFAYGSLLMFFDGLQAAGPYLTPTTFARGLQDAAELAPGKGMYGGWAFGPGIVDPEATFQIVKWVPTAISPEDGKPGTFVACDGGRFFSYRGVSGLPLHTEPDCPDR